MSEICRKPIRFERKALTAISLAALKTNGADPPCSRQSLASRRHGNLSRVGGLKLRSRGLEKSNEGERLPPDQEKAGHVGGQKSWMEGLIEPGNIRQ